MDRRKFLTRVAIASIAPKAVLSVSERLLDNSGPNSLMDGLMSSEAIPHRNSVTMEDMMEMMRILDERSYDMNKVYYFVPPRLANSQICNEFKYEAKRLFGRNVKIIDNA